MEITFKESELWQRYLFWKDMGDASRANYWMYRIKELEQEK